MGMSILWGGRLLSIRESSEAFPYFTLWAQDHIMRPGLSYYRADMGRARAHRIWGPAAPWALGSMGHMENFPKFIGWGV